MRAEELYYPAPRARFQEMIASLGLDLIRRDVLGIKQTPYYLKAFKRAINA